MRYVAYGLLSVLFLTHTDVWYWHDARLILGLPVGLTYHLFWMVGVTAVLWLMVKYCWPDELEHDGEDAP